VTNDFASLQNLCDIADLPSTPLWPLAAGWYLLAAILFISAVGATIKAFSLYRRNTYRRHALAELANLPDSAESMLLTAELLKRTALATYPREQVANLTGEPWLTWLSESGGFSVANDVAETLSQTIYKNTGATDSNALLDFAEKWIRQHKSFVPPKEVGVNPAKTRDLTC